MSEAEEVSRLIALIYESVETPGSWQATLKEIGCSQPVKDAPMTQGSFSAAATASGPSSDDDPSDPGLARFRLLLPHLQRAMRLRRQLDAASPNTVDIDAVMDAIEKPTILANREARLLRANALGAEVVRSRGLILTDRGKIAAQRVDETNSLRKRIDSAATKGAGEPGEKMVVHRNDGTALVLVVCPLPGAQYAGNGQIAAIFINDPERQTSSPVNPGLLRDQYHLTRAEAALVLALLSGATLQSSALRQKIAIPTARTHLAHIFQKTGAHSQSELLHLLRRAGHNS